MPISSIRKVKSEDKLKGIVSPEVSRLGFSSSSLQLLLRFWPPAAAVTNWLLKVIEKKKKKRGPDFTRPVYFRRTSSAWRSNVTRSRLLHQPGDQRTSPTFSWAEEAVHLNAGPWVRHAESRARYQSFLRRTAVGGSDQAPAGPLTGPLQQLHRLTWREPRQVLVLNRQKKRLKLQLMFLQRGSGLTCADGHLCAASCCEVLEDDRQLAAARELPTERRVTCHTSVQTPLMFPGLSAVQLQRVCWQRRLHHQQ